MGKQHKIALIGVGQMGRNHLRVLSENPRVQLVAVVDSRIGSDSWKQALPAGATAGTALADLRQVDFDALVVATPTQTHFEVVRDLLTFKRPVLVEKPICSSSEQSEELLKLAAAAGVFIGVGHVERHNPAVAKLKELIDSGLLGEVIHCSVTRVGGYPENAKKGNNVLLDLAVHDLDVIRMILGDFRIKASFAHSTVQEDIYDTAEIVGVCGNGVSAAIHVNWITPTKIRSIHVTGTRGVCFMDYMLQTCTLMGGHLLRHRLPEPASFQDILDLYRNSDKIEFGVNKAEPLKVQLDQFLNALEGRPHSLCLASDAAAVVQLAEEALRKAEKIVHRQLKPASAA